MFLSDLKAKIEDLHEVAAVLRNQATKLHALGRESDALKLEDIALDCDGAARNVLSPYKGDDPWILTRQSQDVKLRAFVADLASTTAMLFRKELHSTIATVANVLFSRQDLTRSNSGNASIVGARPSLNSSAAYSPSRGGLAQRRAAKLADITVRDATTWHARSPANACASWRRRLCCAIKDRAVFAPVAPENLGRLPETLETAAKPHARNARAFVWLLPGSARKCKG